MELNTNLPGIVGLFAYSPRSAGPMKQLAEVILRDPDFSVIDLGRRELIAGMVSMWNGCSFCMKSHLAVARLHLGEDLVAHVTAAIEVPRDIAEMLIVAANVTGNANSSNWANCLQQFVDAEPEEGEDITPLEGRPLHDVVLIASAFNMYNRYVSGMGVGKPPLSDDDYKRMAQKIVESGYVKASEA
jgi:AhpD family alkylhydroperoxidase